MVPVTIEDAWSAQRRWSRVADAAHARIDLLRRLNLGLLVAAAVAGALGGLIDHGLTQRVFAGIAAGLLALAAAMQQRLTETSIGSWIDTRLASESIKAAVYRALVIDSPATRDALEDALDEAESSGEQHLISFGVTEADDQSVPDVVDVATYRTERARNQMDWHRKKAPQQGAKGRRLRQVELGVTVLGLIASAIAAATQAPWLAIVVTALTTVAAAIAAHIGATKYERIAAGYVRTANRIDRAIRRLPDDPDDDRALAFVDEVEEILLRQNESWAGLNSPS